MKALRKAFRKQFTEEKDAVYVFLISSEHKSNLTGYMPLKGQYGFIFTKNQSETETAHTIAHEIAHGAFHLRHTFSPKNKYVLNQNTTDNLMDYTPGGKALNKYQWDQIHDPENLLFAWLENEEEGEMINILSLVESIREANKKKYNIIEIMQDKCPQGFYKNKKIGDYQLGGLQINCSKEFEGAEIKEETKNTWLTWKLSFAEKAMIMPSENKQIFVQTNLGKAVYFQFHEMKTSDKIPLAHELSDNLLFEFAVLEKDYKDFEYYLFASKELVIEINKLNVSDDFITKLTKNEGKVDHVYNDYKGASSKYCDEHTGHDKIPENSHKCSEDKHKNSKGKVGNPTIGIGHLIYGETELQNWCKKSPISENEIMILFKNDIKARGEDQLKYYINKNVTNAKLNQCQYEALVSIVFNRGIGNVMNSVLWKDYLSEGIFITDDPDKNEKIKDALINDGSDLAGSARRKEEANLYFNCNY